MHVGLIKKCNFIHYMRENYAWTLQNSKKCKTDPNYCDGNFKHIALYKELLFSSQHQNVHRLYAGRRQFFNTGLNSKLIRLQNITWDQNLCNSARRWEKIKRF